MPSRKFRHPERAIVIDRPRPGPTFGDGAVMGAKNPRIVELRRRIGRRGSRSPVILLEGPRTVAEAIDGGFMPSTVVVPEGGADDSGVSAVLDRFGTAVEVLWVRTKVFDQLAPSVTPQPMLALVDRPEAEIPPHLRPDDVVLVLVDVSDPGNVGTLIRVADAVAAACVVAVAGADPWGAKAVRSSTGSVMRVPVVQSESAEATLVALRRAGAAIVGTDAARGVAHDSGVISGPVAIVLGSEAHGLSRDLDSLVDTWVRIDMPGRAESLNVAMAGTLLAFEARRQR